MFEIFLHFGLGERPFGFCILIFFVRFCKLFSVVREIFVLGIFLYVKICVCCSNTKKMGHIILSYLYMYKNILLQNLYKYVISCLPSDKIFLSLSIFCQYWCENVYFSMLMYE